MAPAPACLPRAATAAALLLLLTPRPAQSALRAPAIPLIVTDPFVSVWSPSDNLADSFPMHWAGATIGMVGMLRVDAAAYRWMGVDTWSAASQAAAVPAATQLAAADVKPTQTHYRFAAGGVVLNVTF